MHLELAENGDYLQDNDELYLDQNGELVEGEEDVSPYVFVPGQNGEEGVYVREDYFDDLPDGEWERLMMFLEANQPGLSLFGLGKKGRARRAERRERRGERKLMKISTRAEGRAGVAAAGGGIGGFIGKVGGAVGNILGRGGAPEGEIQSAPSRKWVPWAVGGGIALLAGGIYLSARKRRRR